MGHPEYLHPDNLFIETKLIKFENQELREILNDITQYLRGFYGNMRDQYKSGNPEYELMIEFWDKFEFRQQEILSEQLNTKISKLKKIHAKLLNELKTSEESYMVEVKFKEFNSAEKIFVHLHECYLETARVQAEEVQNNFRNKQPVKITLR